MKRIIHRESRIKKQTTSMRKAIDKGRVINKRCKTAKWLNDSLDKGEDDIDRLKYASNRYVTDKLEKGGRNAAFSSTKKTIRTAVRAGKVSLKAGAYGFYSTKEYKRNLMLKRMREYIGTNGTLDGSGLEDKVKTLYQHEKDEIDNLLKEASARKQAKNKLLNKERDLKLLKSEIKSSKGISDKDLKRKYADFSRNKQMELRQLNKRYKSATSQGAKAAEKAMLKKRAIDKFTKHKSTSGIGDFLKSLLSTAGTVIKGFVISSGGVFIIGSVVALTLIAFLIPSFVTQQSQINTRQQIIEVALREVGTVGGDKYRTWYTGTADGEMWCATFVSWCAEQCGLIEKGIYPKFQSCDAGVEWFKQKGLFDYTLQYDGIDYAPQMGDVIFFTGRDGMYDKFDSTHVGLVQGVENGQVITVEGNTSNKVLARKYSMNNPRILGYARPQYPLGLYETADFSGNNNAEIVWNFLKSMGCSDEAAAGIMGNIHGESSMNPGAIESNGEGHGLCQWSFGRKERLFERAAAAGKLWEDIDVQLMLLWDELNGLDVTTANILNANYGGLAGLKSMSSIELATEAFCLAFERPSNSSLRIQQRIIYARRYYELYANKKEVAA